METENPDENDSKKSDEILIESSSRIANSEEVFTKKDEDIESKNHELELRYNEPNWTVRLISSESFNASMAVEYLFSIRDKPALSFLGKRIFDLPEKEIDFFLPQLIYLYVTKVDVASVTHAYIEKRHNKSAQFTMICIWLLDCFAKNTSNSSVGHATMLRNFLSNTRKAVTRTEDTLLSLNRLEETNWIPKVRFGNNARRLAHDTESQLTAESIPIELDTLLNYQQCFINRLVHIGVKLTEVHLSSSKQEKTTFLHGELKMLNSMLPNSVWIPFDFGNTVLNICIDDSAVLNSKDKVPYIFFAEVLRKPPSCSNSIAELQLKSETLYGRHTPEDIGTSGRNKVFHDVSDPSVAVFAESWQQKKTRIQASSCYENHSEWDLIPVIVKTGDDLSQESFAQQLLFIFKDLWKEEGVPLYVRPYKIVCIGPDTGLVEPVLDTLSLHQIKRHVANVFRKSGNPNTPTLKHYFETSFGPVSSETYVNAQKNFIQSAAAYSLVSYFLQLKDRHNGNILLDMEGHLIHIDYGFLLSSSPRNLGFETAPFKLTSEIIDVMGGIESDMFLYYKSLLLRGLMAARKHHRRIVSLAEIMSAESKMQCFRAGPETIRALEARFHVSSTDKQLQQLVDTLVEGSRDSYTTRFYDSFQYYTNGIH